MTNENYRDDPRRQDVDATRYYEYFDSLVGPEEEKSESPDDRIKRRKKELSKQISQTAEEVSVASDSDADSNASSYFSGPTL